MRIGFLTHTVWSSTSANARRQMVRSGSDR